MLPTRLCARVSLIFYLNIVLYVYTCRRNVLTGMHTLEEGNRAADYFETQLFKMFLTANAITYTHNIIAPNTVQMQIRQLYFRGEQYYCCSTYVSISPNQTFSL